MWKHFNKLKDFGTFQKNNEQLIKQGFIFVTASVLVQLIIFNYNLQMQPQSRSKPNNLSSSDHQQAQQLYTHSRCGSLHHAQPSLPRKSTSSSLSHFLNIDQLIGDIKITPLKHNKYFQHIAVIAKELECLKQHPRISQEILTIQLLIDSIHKKIAFDVPTHSRTSSSKSALLKSPRQSIGLPLKNEISRLQNISPIKQIDDLGSRIVYTRFSLKQMSSPHEQSPASLIYGSGIKTPVKVSNSQEKQNQQMQKLNKQIVALQRMLKIKKVPNELPVEQSINFKSNNLYGSFSQSKKQFSQSKKQFSQSKAQYNSSNKKVTSYKESQNLCPPFRKKMTLQMESVGKGLLLQIAKNKWKPQHCNVR